MSSPKKKPTVNSAVVDVTRKVHDFARLCLYVRAGGRCEFDGCNNYLLEHHVTLKEGNFAQVAHIVAFRLAGPRGKEGTRPADINDVGNLVLLCPGCHKLVDDHPEDYSRVTLEEYKKAHEKRILHLTSLGPEGRTAALVLKARIGGQAVAVPFAQITEAVAPLYPIDREGFVVDLTAFNDTSNTFITTASDEIVERMKRFWEPGGLGARVGRVSVFALAPIPLLVLLGRQLTNKVPTDVYQRHRDTENWTWKSGGKAPRYRLHRRQAGKGKGVALVLSLSGRVPLSSLPGAVLQRNTIYEMTLVGMTPSPAYLRQRRDLSNFRTAYAKALGEIVSRHGLLKTIDLFPAVPTPVAVLCGRELLPKVHPALRVWDYDKAKGGFTFQLEVR